jgi:transposase-like protein
MARKVYNAEFKKSAISLVIEQNYKPEAAARNLGVNLSTLQFRLKKYRQGGKVIDPVEQADLRKRNADLERENTRLRMERDILKKAG